MEGGKKVSLRRFLADQKIASSWGGGGGGGGERFRASYSTSNKLLLGARHILTAGHQKCLKSWQCKIRKVTVAAFHCEESTHRK